jgi:DmsE family decaheme c-type cytochrome
MPVTTLRRRRRQASTALGAAALLALSLTSPAPHPVSGSGQDTAPFPRQGRYVGKDECIRCHGEEARAIAGGAHADVVHSAAVMGCETCHGPGFEHAADADNAADKITYPAALPPAAQKVLCGRCHVPQVEHHGGDMDGFLAAGIGCVECHGVHQRREPAPHPGLRFTTRVAQDASSEPIAANECARCHPLQDARLGNGHHAHLAAGAAEHGCTECHGEGSLHVATDGLARLITRPDRAADGVATCHSCHSVVDPREFHWRGRRSPLLSEGLTCTTCHRVHGEPGQPSPPPSGPLGPDPETGADSPRNDLCATCHEPAFAVLHGTVHESLGRRDIPLAQGCDACHPGGEHHARSGGRRHLVQSLHGSSASTQLQVCGSCHGHEPALGQIRLGAHHRHEVSCLSCHSPAAAKGAARADAHSRCTECHQSVAAELRQPNRHPVPEGHMQCADCHEPHGARSRMRDLELRERRCVECHRQYRGPFVFAHQASRSDGCVVCHTPHGSSNRRLLRQATTQQNCIACHGDFPSFHDQTPGSVFTNCLACHTQVHGSNHSRYLLR